MKNSMCVLAVAAVAWSSSVHANTVGSFGDATGDLVVHYNTGGETPSNQAYITTANSVFNFNQNLAFPTAGYGPGHYFQAVPNQFAFVLSALAPTYNGTNAYPGAVTALHANPNDTTPATQSQSVDWAVTDPTYQNPTSLRVGNSVFRGGGGSGSSIHWTQTLSHVGTLFTLNISGSLDTDGKIWWANAAGSNSNGTSNLSDPLWQAALASDGKVYFHGTLTYDSAGDTDPTADAYHGTINFDLQPAAVPLPAAVWAGMTLLGGMGGIGGLKRLRRNSSC